ncbi:MAG: 3-deoxy-8-phosphooctulonate synthase [Waddliaceae bacterium]|nr:3-deoxy-8-phosphooctulonate synthase [Waddliaceae bacterium]
MNCVDIADFKVGPGRSLVMMCGPCIIENEEHCFQAAETLKSIFSLHDIRLVFKASYDKANRSSINSFRGPGIDEGLRILGRIRKELGIPVVTDVHSPEEATQAGEVVDVLQIPAFLCRQTDLLVAAGNTGKVINVKKGQFMAPWDMTHVVEKIRSTGNEKIILVDRGTSFGYNNLVSDFRAIPIMKKTGCPVCFDASHSVQLPGGLGASSGGQREFIPTLIKAAIAAGANCLFMEAHPEPSKALSDAASVFPFKELPTLLAQLQQLYELIQTMEERE